MEFSHVLLGIATGVPVMIIVGPIALLLIEAGMRNGIRGGTPAALGVAGADLTFATASAVAGVAVAGALAPFEQGLRIAAIGVLGVLAWRLWRSGSGDLAELNARSVPAVCESSAQMGAMHGAPERGAAAVAAPAASEVPVEDRGSLSLLAMAGEYFAITALNPITIVVFTSIVIGGAAGVGTPGWVLGMVLASLMVNMTFVSIGHGLGAVLNERATARLRMGGALLIVALAAYFALG